MSTASTVLFVGVSNLRRGRVAEILFNAAASKLNLSWRAISRGLTPGTGPMPKDALDFLNRANVRDLLATARKPQALADGELESATKVVGFDESAFRTRFPAPDDRVEFWNAKDFVAIESMVNSLIARLLGGGGPTPEPKPEREPKPKKLGPAKVGRETAGRRGKGVTTIFDLTLGEAELKELATKLKNLCGTGGTAKDGRIEIQGDHRDKILEYLSGLGYQAKRSGG